MERPVYLREDVWHFMLDKAEGYAEEELLDIAKRYSYTGQDKEAIIQSIVAEPAAFLFEIGIIEHPHFLRQTVVTLEEDVEYVIDQAAAKQLATGDETIFLTRLFDKQKIGMPREKIVAALKAKCEFDQLDPAKC